jgi:LysM repeat protein
MKSSPVRKIIRYLFLPFLGLALIGCGEKEVKKVAPATVAYHIGMGRAFYDRGEYARAVEMYQKAIVLDDRNPEAYLQLGIIYDDNLKDKKLAIGYYREFLSLAPDSEKAERVKAWITQCRKVLRGEAEAGAEEAPLPSPPSPPASLPSSSPGKKETAIPSPVPGKRTAPPPAESMPPSRTYTVREGDTLARIAQEVYGDRSAWGRIFEANREILSSPHALKPGQVLKIPASRSRAVIQM